MKITALILAGAITTTPPPLEAALNEAHAAGMREKCGRAI